MTHYGTCLLQCPFVAEHWGKALEMPDKRSTDLKKQQPHPQRRAKMRLMLRKSNAMATGSLKRRSMKMEWTR